MNVQRKLFIEVKEETGITVKDIKYLGSDFVRERITYANLFSIL